MLEDINHADYPQWQPKIDETALDLNMEMLRRWHWRRNIPVDIGEIVWLLKSSESHEAIAKKFGISVDTVQEIYNDYIN